MKGCPGIRAARFAVVLLLASLLLASLLLAACGGDDKPASTLTPAQRDSTLSGSALPGAATVKGALDAADSVRVRGERAGEAAGR